MSIDQQAASDSLPCASSLGATFVEPDSAHMPEGTAVLVVASKFNSAIVNPLIVQAMGSLSSWGIACERLWLIRVPGAVETSLAMQTGLKALERAFPGAPLGGLALGAIIKGDTAHFEQVCSSVDRGLHHVRHHLGLPVADGVLTTYTLEQAKVRASEDEHNKGWEAAEALKAQISLIHHLENRV